MGVGLPVARHLNEIFDPSLTITSLELSESSMFGGTVNIIEINLKFKLKECSINK